METIQPFVDPKKIHIHKIGTKTPNKKFSNLMWTDARDRLREKPETKWSLLNFEPELEKNSQHPENRENNRDRDLLGSHRLRLLGL